MFKRTKKIEDDQHVDAVRLRFLREINKFHVVIQFPRLTIVF